MDNELTPHREWERIFDEHLSEVERCGPGCPERKYDADILFLWLPKFSGHVKVWFWGFGVFIVIGVSFLFFILSGGTHNIYDWLSNLLLNLCIGIIGSFLLYKYTLNRDRVLAGYTEVICKMKQRLSLFRNLIGEDGELTKLDPHFMFQTRMDDPSWGIDCLYVYNEFCFTMISYLRYLKKQLGNSLAYDLATKLSVVEAQNTTSRVNIGKLHKSWSESKQLDEESKSVCCSQVNNECNNEIGLLENLVCYLETKVYSLKFGEEGVQVRGK